MMRLFRKKTDYSYYSSYNSRRRGLRIDRAAIAIIGAIVLVLAIVVYLNFNRIQFLMKGYSWSTTSEIVRSFDDSEEKEIYVKEIELVDQTDTSETVLVKYMDGEKEKEEKIYFQYDQDGLIRDVYPLKN